MTKKKCRKLIVLSILFLLSILPLAACGGTFEVGIVGTPTPGSAITSAEVSMATPTTTVEGVIPPTAAPTSEPTPMPIYGPFVLHVAFVKDDNVWLWTEEQEAVPLTTIGGVDDVKISDDGAIIAFTHGGELWVVNRDGTGERPLVTAEAFAAMERREPEFRVALYRYAWVGRTHTLAFNTRLDTGYGLVLNDDLRLVNADTAELAVLLPPGQGGEFVYSPDGSQVAIATPGDIFLADADGANPREALSYTPVATASEFRYYPEPVWSADSSALRVAIAPPDPYVERPQTSIWALRTDGTPAHLMGSIEVARGSQPVFSAYLSQLAYVRLPADGRPGEQGSVVLTDLTSGEMVGDSTIYYADARAIYGGAIVADHQRHALGLGLPAETGARVGQQLTQVDRFQVQGKLPRLGQRERAQVLDQARQEARLVQRGLDVLARGVIDAVEHALQVALDDVQRGAQLVRHVGGQVAPLLVAALQLLHHVVERARQAAKLARPAVRHAHAQVALGHRVGGGHDPGQRGGDAAKGLAGDACDEGDQDQQQQRPGEPPQVPAVRLAADHTRDKERERKDAEQKEGHDQAKRDQEADKERGAPLAPGGRKVVVHRGGRVMRLDPRRDRARGPRFAFRRVILLPKPAGRTVAGRFEMSETRWHGHRS